MKSTFICIFLLSIFACREKNMIDQFHDLRQIPWIIGRWKMEDKEIIESWNRTSDTAISGMAISQENGETKVLEVLKIYEDHGNFYYSATVSDQNEGGTIIFPMTHYSESKVIFENPKHDFPQVIEYTVDETKTRLSVHLEGKGKTQNYKFFKAD